MRLVEEQLAREFGISRPPIRESFRVLEREGLVTNLPRRGVRVKPTSADEVGDIYLCRSVLAGLAARLAAQHITDQLRTELEHSLAQLEALAAQSDVVGYHQEIGRFHEVIERASQNSQLQQLLQSLGVRVRRLSFTSLSLPGRLEASIQFHRQLTAALVRGDAASAERLGRGLLEDAMPALVDYVRETTELTTQL
jgi:DNA-binding GntR family transcriptional regulator